MERPRGTQGLPRGGEGVLGVPGGSWGTQGGPVGALRISWGSVGVPLGCWAVAKSFTKICFIICLQCGGFGEPLEGPKGAHEVPRVAEGDQWGTQGVDMGGQGGTRGCPRGPKGGRGPGKLKAERAGGLWKTKKRASRRLRAL